MGESVVLLSSELVSAAGMLDTGTHIHKRGCEELAVPIDEICMWQEVICMAKPDRDKETFERAMLLLNICFLSLKHILLHAEVYQ